jgi:hypothetical protein
MAKKINYNSRNFNEIRTELVNYVKQYYPDTLSDFNDASVGMMLLELNAAVGDMLSFNTDRMFQETQIDYAQQRSSVMAMARTFGLKIPGKRPSATIVDFTVTLPVRGDTFDLSYAPIIRRGAQVSGSGRVFETLDDIDFSSPFATGGIPNRLIIPNFNSNNTIVSYQITKREIVTNGVTKIFSRTINESDVRPFIEVVLPDNDVLSINSVIVLEGTSINSTPSLTQFYNDDLRWFEVDALAQDTIFIEDKTMGTDNIAVKPGKFKRVDQRFIREYTDNGFCKLIFGAGTEDISSLTDFDVNKSLINRIGDFINNYSLGAIPKPNSTMFISYRTGGGTTANVGPNVITSVSSVNMSVNGPNNQINQAVRKSLKVNNPIPALGGKDEPSVEEVRNMVRYNFSSQNRAVTIEDYKNRISQIPGIYGVPFRNNVLESQNKIKVYVMTLDNEGKLSSNLNNTIKSNIATYLSDFRMINDYVEVDSGKVYNIAFEIDLFLEKGIPQSQVISETISKIRSYFDINKWEMGENIYLGQLIEEINNTSGVINVVDLRIFNMVGQGLYSSSEIPQEYSDEDTRQINLLGENTLFGDPTGMFEIKYPEKNIRIRVK